MRDTHWFTDLPKWRRNYALTLAGAKIAKALNLLGDVRLDATPVDGKTIFQFRDDQNARWAQDRLQVDHHTLERTIAWQVEHAALDIAAEVLNLFEDPAVRCGPNR